MQVKPGIFRVQSINQVIYALDCGGAYALVDCGDETELENKLAALRADGISPDHIVAVLLTHFHWDHSGALAKLRELVPLQVVAHRHSIEPLTHTEPLDRNLVDHTVDDGDIIEIGTTRLHVYHLPGHTHDSVAYQWGQELFIGDITFEWAGIGWMDVHWGSCVSQYKDSLNRMLSLRPATLYPGHGGMCTLSEYSIAHAIGNLDILEKIDGSPIDDGETRPPPPHDRPAADDSDRDIALVSSPTMRRCTAVLNDGLLTLSTGRLARTWRWNGGRLIGLSLADVRTRRRWDLRGDAEDMGIPGLDSEVAGGDLHVEELAETALRPAHVAVTVTARLGPVETRRVFRLYPDGPALPCELYLRGAASGSWRPDVEAAGDQRNVEDSFRLAGARWNGPHLERLRLPERHWRARAVLLRDITDLHNNLVQEERFIPYNHLNRYVGNLLFLQELHSGAGMFLLKECPCSDVQLAPSGADFIVSRVEVTVGGVGLDPEDLDPQEWRRGYGVTIGLGESEEELHLALHEHYRRRRPRRPERDDMVLVNTWGDRGQDAHLGEEFAFRELEACARLGASHLQLDDGWQTGLTSNSAFENGSLEGIWKDRTDYWAVHPGRFPRGLAPLLARAHELGIEVGLWFNPSKDDDNAHWADDADTLLRLHREYGIRTFKIDGVSVPNAPADRNFRALLDRVREGSNGEVVFNLDVTAGRRWGYVMGLEYGLLFLENRYTDWQNYYPCWTLRNLWQLSRYVPAQSLQIEFLNPRRNLAKYAPDDPLRPEAVPLSYSFALTMMAQPLGWFEAQHLGDGIEELAPLIHTYRQHMADLHAGTILPIGEEPSGVGWAGFQSRQEGRGYLLILREWNDRSSARLKLWGLAGKTLALSSNLGIGRRPRRACGRGRRRRMHPPNAAWLRALRLPRAKLNLPWAPSRPGNEGFHISVFLIDANAHFRYHLLQELGPWSQSLGMAFPLDPKP